MDLKKIKQIIDLMAKNDLSEFSYEECNNYKIRLRKGGVPVITNTSHSAPAQANTAPTPVTIVQDNAHIVESPLVGTFYSSSSPKSPIYVKVGDTVSEDTVICIVEAMKVMNEITAGVKGTIVDILVNNADPVEYGQPLFKIKDK